MKFSQSLEKKDQVKEVGTGFECGISIKDFIDFKEKDVIESYISEEIRDQFRYEQPIFTKNIQSETT